MRTTTLGRTGMEVSRLCLGCMSYGSPDWRPWVLDADGAEPFFRERDRGRHQLLRHRRHVLARRQRGGHRPVAARVRRSRRASCIATKVFFPMSDRPNTGGLSRKHIQQACEASLRRLGVETIDLYQVHRFDPHTPIEETLAALDQLVRQGQGAAHRRQLDVRLGADAGARHLRAGGPRPLRDHAEPLQPRVPRGGARDDAALRDRGDRLDPVVAAGARPAGRQRARRWGTTRPRGRPPTGSTDALRPAGATGRWWRRSRPWPPSGATSRRRWRWPGCCRRPAVAAPIVGATKLAHLADAVAAVDIELSAEEIALLEAPYQPHEERGIGPSAVHARATR